MYQAQNNMNQGRTQMPPTNGQNMDQKKSSYIRLLHASPDAPAVDIYINDIPVASNVNYKDITKYIALQAGNYNVKVYPAGDATNAVIAKNLSIPPNSVYTVAAIGYLQDINLLPIPEPVMANTTGEACIRFVHLSPSTPNVDIRLGDGTSLFEDLAFTDMTKYVCVPPGAYTFQIFLSDDDTNVLTVADVPVEGDKYYTAYALATPGEAPNLEALLVVEPRM